MKLKMKGSYRALLCSGIVSFFFMQSCTKNFDEYATNIKEPTDSILSIDYKSIGSFIPTMQRGVFTDNVNSYQLGQNLNADLFSGYMGTQNAFNNGQNNSNYFLIQAWNHEAFNIGLNIATTYDFLNKRAGKDFPSFVAVAKIIKVLAMQRVSDVYGPVPYTKIGTVDFGTPYDSQEDAYKAFFDDINDAIAQLELLKDTETGLSKYDLVYGGDITKWIKFANSLKLRMAMRVVYADETLAKKNAEEAVAAGVMSDNSDNAFVKSGLGFVINNPLAVIEKEYDDIRMGASAESILRGYNDPRMSVYFLPSTTSGSPFRGIRYGNEEGSKRSSYSAFSRPNVQATTPIQWMVAAESYFLRAEGALRGWAMDGDAKSLYEKGIEVSFIQHTPSANFTSYINNNTNVPLRYTDPVTSAQSIAAQSNITIRWNASDNFERNLERIITQKWIAIYPDGQEAWSEFRRTGYPKLFPVLNNKSGGLIPNFIRRLPFSFQEYSSNQAQVEIAIQLLGGPDNGGTKLWWDKKD